MKASKSSKARKDDGRVVDYTLRLLRMQHQRVVRDRAHEDKKDIDAKIDEAKKAGKYGYSEFKAIRNAHLSNLKRAQDFEDLLVKLSVLSPIKQAVRKRRGKSGEIVEGGEGVIFEV